MAIEISLQTLEFDSYEVPHTSSFVSSLDNVLTIFWSLYHYWKENIVVVNISIKLYKFFYFYQFDRIWTDLLQGTKLSLGLKLVTMI